MDWRSRADNHINSGPILPNLELSQDSKAVWSICKFHKYNKKLFSFAWDKVNRIFSTQGQVIFQTDQDFIHVLVINKCSGQYFPPI